MAVARALLLTLIVATLPAALPTAADSGQLVPKPAWEYHFPPGLLDTLNLAVTPDYRYLAIVSGQWTYHPKDRPDEATTEGENAIYVFDLRRRKLLWKQVLPEGRVPLVRGISLAAEFTAVQMNPVWAGNTHYWEHDGQRVEGRQPVGPPEAGLRLYDRRGALVATNAPLQQLGSRRPYDTLVLRPLERGEEPVSEELRHRLAAAGIREVDVLPPPDAITRRSRNGAPCIVGLGSDGAVRWEWPVPADQTLESSARWPLALSPDGECALAGYLLVAPESSPTTRRFHFFRRADGWQWSRDLPAMLWLTSWTVSNAGRSTVIRRDLGGHISIDILGPDGQTKSQRTFYGIAPVRSSLSPNGKYWAAVLVRWAKGPGASDMDWTEGLHVFDCDTGKVVWRAPLPPRNAWELIALDSGGVIAISETRHTLAVFEPPTRAAR